MTETTTDVLAGLTYDGDSVEFENGQALALRIEPDYDASINDYECYGELSDWTRDGDYGSTRPDDFGPHARIIARDRGATRWWQPLPDVWGTPKPWGPHTFDDDWATARRLYEEGFAVVILELHELVKDSTGREHDVLVDYAALGGVDDAGPAYIRQLVGDLAAELGVTIKEGS